MLSITKRSDYLFPNETVAIQHEIDRSKFLVALMLANFQENSEKDWAQRIAKSQQKNQEATKIERTKRPTTFFPFRFANGLSGQLPASAHGHPHTCACKFANRQENIGLNNFKCIHAIVLIDVSAAKCEYGNFEADFDDADTFEYSACQLRAKDAGNLMGSDDSEADEVQNDADRSTILPTQDTFDTEDELSPVKCF